jgi:hypothetical protein
MTEIVFGDKETADEFRINYQEHICPDDDKRLKTVKFRSDTPQEVLDAAARIAADSRNDRDTGDGPGQPPLTDAEKARIDFSKDRANVLWASSIKGIAQSEGVDDWTAHVDPTLTVDEHWEIMEKAAREDRGSRNDQEVDLDEQLADANAVVESEQCDHAEGHCRHGDPDACEFLTEACGYEQGDIEQFLEDDDQEDLTGKEAGAYHRALGGYRGAIGTLEELVDAVREQRRYAEQAWAAMAAIRKDSDQDVEEPRELHRLLEDLEQILDDHRESTTHETTTDDVDRDKVLEVDDQRDLEGARANDQARLAGGEQGDRGQGEVETRARHEYNEGGLKADLREDDEQPTGEETEQAIPDEFQTAEGGQRTL